MAKSKTPFGVTQSGDRYVQASAIMHPLCWAFDGLPVVFFGKDKHAYLKIGDAIAWCEREGRSHDGKKYAEIVKALIRFRDAPNEALAEDGAHA